MRNLKKQALFVAALAGLSPLLHAADTGSSESPYYVTLAGAYGRPFETDGYSGSNALGLGGSASLEYRGWDTLTLGAGFDHVAITEKNVSINLGSVDILARLLPYGRRSVEPYILSGLGGVVYANASDSIHRRDISSIHAKLQMGMLFKLNAGVAIDIGLAYQFYGPPASSLNYLDLRLGLQARFGPAPQVVNSQKKAPAKNNTGGLAANKKK